MAALDDLIGRISDEGLRSRLRNEVRKLRDGLRFGLVFEAHLPETAELPGAYVRAGAGALRDHEVPGMRFVRVLEIDGDCAEVSAVAATNADTERVPLSDLRAAADLETVPVLPLLEPCGEISGPGAVTDGQRHLVIESENYHALSLLGFTHAGRVDCIYIDPPYNTGATDWAYNNAFVDENDGYRHSKWLAMMSRRLRLARRLLKPDGVLIVTIDECENHRLGMLLDQIFPDATHQTVTVKIMAAGNARETFTRVDEYAHFCFFGRAAACGTGDDLLSGNSDVGNRPPKPVPVRWEYLLRSGNNSRPQDRPGLCYPIYIGADGALLGVGRTLADRAKDGEMSDAPETLDAFTPAIEGKTVPSTAETAAPEGKGPVLWPHDEHGPAGTAWVLWPRDKDSGLATWRLAPDELLRRHSSRMVEISLKKGEPAIRYLYDSIEAAIASGDLSLAADDPGSGPYRLAPIVNTKRPMTMWNRSRHDAGIYGTTLLKNMLGGKRFDFPKSLYSTLDAVAAAVADRPDAVVLDFFAGSGTTLHAVSLMNLADGGNRQCLLVTNNEVSAGEAARLREAGHRPGDPEWEDRGVFRRVTRPRVASALTGRTPAGTPVDGKHKYLPVPIGPQLLPDYEPKVHERPISAGLPQTAAFARLRCADPQRLAWGAATLDEIAVMLWAASGCHGPIPQSGQEPVPLTGGRHEPGWLLPGDSPMVPAGCRYAVLLRASRVGMLARNLTASAHTVDTVWVIAHDDDEQHAASTALRTARPEITTYPLPGKLLAHFRDPPERQQ